MSLLRFSVFTIIDIILRPLGNALHPRLSILSPSALILWLTLTQNQCPQLRVRRLQNECNGQVVRISINCAENGKKSPIVTID